MTLIGEKSIILPKFEGVEEVLFQLKKLLLNEQIDAIFSQLLFLITNAPKESFLLAAVIDYLKKVNKTGIFLEPVTFAFFEFWLNQKSELSYNEELEVRAKIIGKYLPRQEYQLLFPIGLGNTFSGSHFVAAHRSPDIDTTISSLLGWIDAFGAKLCTGLHHWSLPGGPPDTSVTKLLENLFGPELFTILAKRDIALSLTALDLISNINVLYLEEDTSIRMLDHGAYEKALILVDKQGTYLGDWRTSDIERVDQIIRLLDYCFEWIHESISNTLIDSFKKEHPTSTEIKNKIHSLFSCPLLEQIPPDRQEQLHRFFKIALDLQDVSFYTVAKKLKHRQILHPIELINTLSAIEKTPLFKNGKAINSRSLFFSELQKISDQSQQCLKSVKKWIEKLSNALIIKEKVLEIHTQTLSLKSSVDEIRAKIGTSSYLTVLFEQHGKKIPLGVVWAYEVRNQELGTVSFRDFCNKEEVRKASYLSLISVIDHHKSVLETTTAASLLVADTQATNVLLAEKLFIINDTFSTLGQSKKILEQQLRKKTTQSLQKRLLHRLIAYETRNGYWINQDREFIELMLITHAILDDTDLLSKITPRDLTCVIELLNRMKTLTIQTECELIAYHDIPKDSHFTKTLARRILSQDDMYSLYRKATQDRELEIEEELKSAKKGNVDPLIKDTKEQNLLARIGQIKLFANNIATLNKVFEQIVIYWKEKAETIYQEQPEIDFHLQMISTIPSAIEVKKGTWGHWEHSDFFIFWTPETQLALEHLSLFLNRWKEIPEVKKNTFHLNIWGPDPHWYEEIFRRNFLPIKIEYKNKWQKLPSVALLKFNAGTLNSRKAVISPFLPKLLE